jgi:hypothetical protein
METYQNFRIGKIKGKFPILELFTTLTIPDVLSLLYLTSKKSRKFVITNHDMIRNITPIAQLSMGELDLLDLNRLRDLENLMTAYPGVPLLFSRVRLNFKGAHTELQAFEGVIKKLADMNPQLLHLMCQALNKPHSIL